MAAAETKDQKSDDESSCFLSWLRFCKRLNDFFNKVFTKIGFVIAEHPKITICSCLALAVILMSGFARYRLITRVEDLYIPQNSKAIQDLHRGHNYFPVKLRAEEFIIKKKNGGSALDHEVFSTLLQVHFGIMNIPGLNETCFKDALGDCVVQTPLQIFNYTITNKTKIFETLNFVYSRNHILPNGRDAFINFPDYFAYFQFDPMKNRIIRADAVRNLYFVKYPENDATYKSSMAWEGKYIEYMEKMEKILDDRGLILLYSSGRSLDDSIEDSAGKDIQLITVSFAFMILFCTVTLAKFRNKVVGHFILGVSGVFILALGIGASFGLVMLTGYPYIAFAGVLPFLVLGVGIDNMFIISDCLDRQHPNIRGSKRIATALGHVGASITMTTLTDLVAFAVSMVTDFPAIEYFCLYAAVSIAVCYLLVITMFVACLSLDVRRIENGRNDFLPCLVSNNNLEDIWVAGDYSISSGLMKSYATMLMKKPVKYTVFILSLILLGFGVWGACHVDQSFEMLDLGLDGSAYVRFYGYRNKAYPTGFHLSVILDAPVDYTDPVIQKEIIDLSDVPFSNEFMKKHSVNWMKDFKQWASYRNLSTTGVSFYPHFSQFIVQHRHVAADIKFNENRTRIIASRILLFNKDDDNSIVRKDTMLSLREDLEESSNLPVYVINLMFIYIEQFVIILRDTVRNLVICACAILFITLPYLTHPAVTLLVFFGFISLIFELLGMMYLWGVSLNSISMVVIVMAIGFAVDYSAHVAHAYIVSKERTPETRIIDALKTMGTSVLMGGTSTFVGIIVTAFASSELFRIFFKMVFGIVLLGLIHGLVILPVSLAIFCRFNFHSIEESFKDGDREMPEAVANGNAELA